MFQFLKSLAEQHPARAGSISGLFQQGCGMMVALLLIPVVTQRLPSDEAGIWFAFQSLVSMLCLLDLGFGFAVCRQTAFTLGANANTTAKDDLIHLAHGWTGVAQLFHLTRTLYRALAGAALIIGFFAFEVLSRVGNLVPVGTPGVRWCWYCIVATSSLLILATGKSALLNGLGAVYQTRLLLGLYQILAGTGAAFAAWKGWGLIAMGGSFALSAVVYKLSVDALHYANTKRMREAKIIPPPHGSLKHLAKAALPIGGLTLFGSLVHTAQVPIIGMLLGPEKVAPFYLAQRIAISCTMLSMQATLPQLPFFTRALGANDFAGASVNMERTILRTSILVALTTATFYFLSPWAASVLLHKTTFVDHVTRLIMAVDIFFLGCSVIWGQYVLAEGRNPFVISTILTGITSLSLTLILAPSLGTAGLPLATLVAGVVFNYRRNLTEGIRTLKRFSIISPA